MKKTIYILLLVCFALFFVTYAAAAVSLGDIDANGAVQAADARLALRFTIGLQKPDAKNRTPDNKAIPL